MVGIAPCESLRYGSGSSSRRGFLGSVSCVTRRASFCRGASEMSPRKKAAEMLDPPPTHGSVGTKSTQQSKEVPDRNAQWFHELSCWRMLNVPLSLPPRALQA